MIGPSFKRHGLAAWLFLAITGIAGPAAVAQTTAATESSPGQFFTITEPITNETIQHIRAATRQLVEQERCRDQRKKSDPRV